MSCREALDAVDSEIAAVEAVVFSVRSSRSDEVKLRVVLVIDGGEGVATVRVLVRGGGGAEGEAMSDRGGVSLWSTFFETGEDVDSAAFGCLVSLFEPERCCLEGCFFVPEIGSIIVSHADLE